MNTTVVISLTNTTAGSDCQTLSGHIPGDEFEQGIDGYRGWESNRWPGGK